MRAAEWQFGPGRQKSRPLRPSRLHKRRYIKSRQLGELPVQGLGIAAGMDIPGAVPPSVGRGDG